MNRPASSSAAPGGERRSTERASAPTAKTLVVVAYPADCGVGPFLVSDPEFDAAYRRLKAAGIEHWADPSKRTAGEINHHDGGRGVYWDDPDGHLLEIITRPYGAETEASGG